VALTEDGEFYIAGYFALGVLAEYLKCYGAHYEVSIWISPEFHGDSLRKASSNSTASTETTIADYVILGLFQMMGDWHATEDIVFTTLLNNRKSMAFCAKYEFFEVAETTKERRVFRITPSIQEHLKLYSKNCCVGKKNVGPEPLIPSIAIHKGKEWLLNKVVDIVPIGKAFLELFCRPADMQSTVEWLTEGKDLNDACFKCGDSVTKFNNHIGGENVLFHVPNLLYAALKKGIVKHFAKRHRSWSNQIDYCLGLTPAYIKLVHVDMLNCGAKFAESPNGSCLQQLISCPEVDHWYQLPYGYMTGAIDPGAILVVATYLGYKITHIANGDRGNPMLIRVISPSDSVKFPRIALSVMAFDVRDNCESINLTESSVKNHFICWKMYKSLDDIESLDESFLSHLEEAALTKYDKRVVIENDQDAWWGYSILPFSSNHLSDHAVWFLLQVCDKSTRADMRKGITRIESNRCVILSRTIFQIEPYNNKGEHHRESGKPSYNYVNPETGESTPLTVCERVGPINYYCFVEK
jgi:hypothetical protein